MVQQYGDTATLPEDGTHPTTQSYEEARAAAHRAMNSVTLIPDKPLPPDLGPDQGTAQGAVQGAVPGPVPGGVDPDVDPELLAYRGFKFGAAFFGWLITIAMSVLLGLAVSAVALGTAEILDYTRSDAEAQAGAASITAAAAAVLTLSLAFYIGGYVAGRLARFDGGRQGFGVWMFALLFTILSAGVGLLLNSQYDLLAEVNRPTVPLPADTLTIGAVAAAAALLVLTLLAAIIGGKTGRRYHDKIDRLLE